MWQGTAGRSEPALTPECSRKTENLQRCEKLQERHLSPMTPQKGSDALVLITLVLLFLGVTNSLPLTFDLRLAAGCVFVGMCSLCGALSSSFRCSVLLMFPSMLGSRGRAYLLLIILSVLYTGPVSNIQRNIQRVGESLSCNLDLQVHNSKLLWREAMKPFALIMQELKDSKGGFQSEARSLSSRFQSIRDEVVHQYGYDGFKPNQSTANTQKQFSSSTMMQCDSVVQQGIQHCADWFRLRWAACMEVISVPIINHILCVPMKFNFLCDVMKVMTAWCREHVPLEGNFGQLFDQVNLSVGQLSREFRADLIVQEQKRQLVLDGALLDDEFYQVVRESYQMLAATMQQLLDVLYLLRSFGFIAIFIQASGYLRGFSTDIRFDNVYITTYFRQIDARRKKVGKRCLLPLRVSEKLKFIDPSSPRVHPEELKQVVAGVVQVLSLLPLSVVLLAVDFSVFHVLDIISSQSLTQFNVTSGHQMDIQVGGDTMLARLLKKSVVVFNSSSSVHIVTDNQSCVLPPSPLPAGVYISCLWCILLVVLFSFLQVYTNRLRRVIASFYWPKREKKRILFLYNLQIQRRILSSHDRRSGDSSQSPKMLDCPGQREASGSSDETFYDCN
ncbi:E3 ubiquitin-protein ligase DCST1 [Aulostomus maculatus]